MMNTVYLLALTLLATAHARTIHLQDLQLQPYIDVASDQFDFDQEVHPVYLTRVRRQLGSMSTNPDGTANVNLKVPLVAGGGAALSAVGSAAAVGARGPGYAAAGGGLAFDHINGHGLSVTGQHVPGFGDQLTAAARLALVNTPEHRLAASAFATRNMPSIPNLPNFSTRGAGVDYTFRDRVGASLAASHTPLFQKTDLSAMGNLNLYRSPASSLDLTAGYSRSRSPIPAFNTGWKPQAGLTFSRYF